jgi:hypothetical protein
MYQYSLGPLGTMQGGPQGPHRANQLGRDFGAPPIQHQPNARVVQVGRSNVSNIPQYMNINTASNTRNMMPMQRGPGMQGVNPNLIPGNGGAYNPSTDILGLLQSKGGHANYLNANDTIPKTNENFPALQSQAHSQLAMSGGITIDGKLTPGMVHPTHYDMSFGVPVASRPQGN